MATKTPLATKSFEERRAEIWADIEKFQEVLQSMRARYTGADEEDGLMEEAVKLFTRALDNFQIKGYLTLDEVFQEKKLLHQALQGQR